MIAARQPHRAAFTELVAEGFVLAGGRSSRMGRDKALVEFAGAPLIARAIHTLELAGLPASIAGARSDLSRFASVIPDTFANLGPLAGVHAALAAGNAGFAVLIPVDMPLLPAPLLRCLLDRATRTRAAVTCLRCNGFLHPFPAILHRSLLSPLTRELQSGTETGCMKMWRKLAAPTATDMDAPAIESLLQTGQLSASPLPPTLWLQSANTPQELQRLEKFIPPLIAHPQIT